MTGLIGSKIRENYRIEAEIGAGGMGVVYRAVDLGSGEFVAIKVISPKALADPERLRRFRNEAKLASSIQHPGIVGVREVGAAEIGGQTRDFIVMELVSGITLAERIKGRPLPLREALHYAIQVVAALDAAHQSGVIHRDVKPANVIIDEKGNAKLADFGLAKMNERPADPFAETGSVQLDLTHDGTIIGSVAYMSPEQARGLEVDHRTDIFSFGSVFYEMLSGKPAFDGATTADKLSAVLTRDPEDIPDLPVDLNIILMRCLRKDLGRRWQTASELRSALEDIRIASDASGNTTLILRRASTRRVWLTGAAGLGLGLIPSAYLLLRKTPRPTFQRLTFRSGDVTGARFAPGGLVAFTAAWDGAPSELFTCQPGNREPRPLGLPHSVLKGVTAANQAALISDNDNTLSIVSLGGGEPRPRLQNVLDACWGPDGESLAIVQQAGPAQFKIEYPIGTKRYECSGRPPQSLKISPNGKEIAFFEFVPQLADYQLVVAPNQGKPRVVSTGWRGVGGILWNADRNELWFNATRANDDPGVYAYNLEGKGRVLVDVPDWLYLHDRSSTGDMLVAPTQSRLSIRIGGAGRPERSHSWLDSSTAYDISADDQQVLFAELSYASGRNPFIFIRNLDGSPARRIGEGNRPALSPNGKLVVCTKAVGSNICVAILPNGPGDGMTLAPPGWSFEVADWMPDSRNLLVYGRRDDSPFSSHILPPNGAPGRAIAPPGVRAIKASPDGRFAAGVERGRLKAYPIQPEEAPRDVAPALPGEAVIRWTSRGIFTRQRLPEKTIIFSIDPASGRRSSVYELTLPEVGSGFIEPTVLSPSGNVYAYTYQRDIASLYLATGIR